MWFWRSHDGMEVDLLVQGKAGLLAIEVKCTATPTSRHSESLAVFRQLAAADGVSDAVVVCAVDVRRPLSGGVVALPWQEFAGWLGERL